MEQVFSWLGIVFWLVPLALALVAIVDVFRIGAEYYWICVILMFPLLGSIVYFVARRSWSRHVSLLAERRNLARRRLREINVQLTHWRGPALLAEAGEELLALGKYEEAERLLREARESGAGVEEVNFPLAQALEMKGRFAEAEPPTRRALSSEPGFPAW